MSQTFRSTALAAITLLFLAATSFAQYGSGSGAGVRDGVQGTVVGTVVDLDEARNRLQLEPDGDRYAQITVETDSVTTTYRGFGGMINGKPEIFSGSQGFSNLREGDRVEVRGMGRTNQLMTGTEVTLLGRQVDAPSTGVGSTRDPASISTSSPQTATPRPGRVEGVVRQVNGSGGTIVIETDRREILNVRAASGTPVYYRGEVYQIANLEPGDRVRVEVDESGSTSREIRARSIDVTQTVQDGGEPRRVGSITGRVTRVDGSAGTVQLNTGRDTLLVDMSNAFDATQRRIRASDLRVGDSVEISGNYNSAGDTFTASTVRYASTGTPGLPPDGGDRDGLVIVTIAGVVTAPLDGPTLSIRDRNNRIAEIWVVDDFVVRTKAGGYTTADKLKTSDSVTIQTYRDLDGNYVAQTIRIR